MTYEKVFPNVYPDGWKNDPSTATPITAKSLNQYNDTIRNIENYLKDLIIPSPRKLEDVGDVNLLNKNPNSAIFVDPNAGSYKWNGKDIPSGKLEFNNNFIPATTTDTDYVSDLKGGYVKVGNYAFFQLKVEISQDYPYYNYNVNLFYDLPLGYTDHSWYTYGIAVRESDGAIVPVQFQNRALRLYGRNTQLVGSTTDMIGTWNVTLLIFCKNI